MFQSGEAQDGQKEETERSHFAIRAANIGFWEVDLPTNTVKWDGRCQELYGLTKDRYIPYAEAIRYIHPDDLESVNAAVQQALAGENDGYYDMRYRTIGANDGKLRWVHFSGRAYFNEKGQAIRFGGIGQDITYAHSLLKKTEQTLRDQEALFRHVTNSAPTGLWLSDEAGGLTYLNHTLVEWTGMAYNDLLGAGWANAIIGEDRARSAETFLTAVASRTHYDTRFRIKKADGAVTWCRAAGDPYYREDGSYAGYAGFCMDIDELVQQQQAASQSEAFLKEAIEVAELATWSIDVSTGQLTYSSRLYEWYGIDPEKHDISAVIDLVEPADRQRVADAIQKAMTPGSEGIFDEEFTIKSLESGRKRVVHSQGKVLLDVQGNPVKLVGTAQDITVHRQLQLALEQEIQQRTEELDASNEELQAANEELATANEELAVTNEELAVTNEELTQSNDNLQISNQDLQQFAHVASHDLKEPLRKIQTFLSRLEMDTANVYSPKSITFFQKINHSVNRMQTMIEGVLSYSRVNASGQKMEDVSIGALISNIQYDLEVLITEKGASLKYSELPTVEGSQILLYQLFYNLVINALKFAAAGRPTLITITADPIHQRNAHFYKIEVADNGIGFPQADAEKIFNTFTRLNTKDHYEGTGLGLALCKKIALRHHGSIEAYGEIDKGARFVIYLPKHQPFSTFIKVP